MIHHWFTLSSWWKLHVLQCRHTMIPCNKHKIICHRTKPSFQKPEPVIRSSVKFYPKMKDNWILHSSGRRFYTNQFERWREWLNSFKSMASRKRAERSIIVTRFSRGGWNCSGCWMNWSGSGWISSWSMKPAFIQHTGVVQHLIHMPRCLLQSILSHLSNCLSVVPVISIYYLLGTKVGLGLERLLHWYLKNAPRFFGRFNLKTHLLRFSKTDTCDGIRRIDVIVGSW